MPPSQRTFSARSAPRSAAVVPSSDPIADARTLTRLLPGRYALESSSSAAAGSAVLVGRSSSTEEPGDDVSDVILLIDSASSFSAASFVGGGVSAAPPGGGGCGGFFPSATLVLDDSDVSSAMTSLRKGSSATIAALLASSPTDPRENGTILPPPAAAASWCVIRLPGGSAVVLASRAALLSPEARRGLAAEVLAAAGSVRKGGDAAVAAGDGDVPRPRSDGSIGGGGSPDDSDREEAGEAHDDGGRLVEVDLLDGEGDGGPSGLPPPPSYDFPSLSMNILSDGRVVPGFRINSRVGIPIDTDLFEGRILLIMRPPNSADDDPYWHEKVFSKKKRRFEVQIQGKFKYTPKGTVYCGAEVTEEMKLGLVSKGLCNMLLKLLTKMVSAEMHFSFGGGDDSEMPHIVFTAWSFFDRLVVTEPGDTPPPIGEPFPEPAKSAASRKASTKPGEWRQGVTYSMSFNSMYLDFPTWHLKNLPMMKDIDLRTFWGDSLLRIVIYEKGVGRNETRHVTADNRYIFVIETEFLGTTDNVGEKRKVEDRDSLPWDKARPAISRTISSVAVPAVNDDVDSDLSEQPIIEESEEDDADSDTDATEFFDAEETASFGTDVGMDLDEFVGSGGNGTEVPMTQEAAKPRSRAVPLSPADMLCPGWIEMIADRGRHRSVYAFVVGGGSRTVFRSAAEFARFFSIEDARRDVEATCSPRVSSAEKLRRVMGQTLAAAKNPSSRQHARYRTFSKKKAACDDKFLRRGAPSVLNAKVKGVRTISGFVARALSDRHWMEEWAILTDRHISFFHPENKRPSFRVSLAGMLSVNELPLAEGPNFPGCYVLVIETTGRRIYLMYYSDEERSRWLSLLSQGLSLLLAGNTRSESVQCCSTSSKGSAIYDELLALDDPTEEFLHKTSVFSCKQRRVLNCRKFVFSSLGQSGMTEANPLHPCDLVERALRRALEPMEDSEDSNLSAFLDSAADLKAVNVANLPEAERMVFFLNLYHVMVMHAFLVLGVPDSSFKWVSYFNMISYQCSDDIFSLTELEHCIIRDRMSSPTQFIAKFVLPKSRYRFALGSPRNASRSPIDYRINFALNCGSMSSPCSIPIFDAATLEGQLNDCARRYLKGSVKVADVKKGVIAVTLPRICQWYAADFGRGRSTDIVRLVMKFLRQSDQELLSKALADDGRHFRTGALQVNFSSFDYHCRLLSLRDE